MKKYKTLDLVLILLAIAVFSGIFGFIYETIFYRIDLGYFVKRGITYGPWIPIYAFGGIFIFLFTHPYKNKPLLVFALACIVSGLLEFGTGYALYHISGIRLWDYNTEILNYGNIGGYICLRSILFFGVSGLFLMYFVMPIILNFRKKYGKVFKCLISVLGIMFTIDFIISSIIS